MNNPTILFPQLRDLILPWVQTPQDKKHLNLFAGSFLAFGFVIIYLAYNIEYSPPPPQPVPQSLINTIITERENKEKDLEEQRRLAEEAARAAAQAESEKSSEEDSQSAKVDQKVTKKPSIDDKSQARKKASQEGLAALSSELSDLGIGGGGSGLPGESFGNLGVSNDIKTVAPGVRTGSVSGTSGGVLALEGNTAGSGSQLVTNRGAIGSGNAGQLRKGDGGSAGSGIAVREGALGGAFGPGSGPGGSGGLAGKGGSGAGKQIGGGRTAEEVQIVFDTNKGLLDRLYQKELRVNPTIKGEILFEITISPSGSVVSVKILSSQLKSPELESKMVDRIKLFIFQAKPASAGNAVIRFPINFLPSG
ncbi:MAG: AgmX/PglI C-terminal domain-containing protein [Methylacidiphilales bacterium]|nr:AgmX/PglI C-terminal domain-containing protein [Candidatus Methylacidiphilales bacterium]